jgi:thiamine kinase-like enzyme
VHRLCHDAGLSPALQAFGRAISVSSLVDAARTLQLEEMRGGPMQQRVLELVARFHSATPAATLRTSYPSAPPMSPITRCRARLAWLCKCGRESDALVLRLQAAMDYLTGVEKRLAGLFARSGRVECAVHSDVTPANFLLDDADRLWLLDFEYATLGDPLWDLGSIASLNQLAPLEVEQLITRAVTMGFGGTGALDRDAVAATVRLYTVLVNLQEASWGLLQSVVSKIDFSQASWTGGIASFSVYAEEWLARVERAIASGDVAVDVKQLFDGDL